MNGKISVSVVIPARNAEDTLDRALNSVLTQTLPSSEIIVVDDASNDGTARLARLYANQGVSLLSLPERRGAAAARNRGIGSAKGRWVAFLDADDEWLPTKLEKQVAAISANPEAPFIFCASEEFSSDGQSLGDTFRGWPVIVGKEAWKALLACNFVATPTVVACRRLLLQLGGFDESLKVAEDQDLWIRLALLGSPVYVSESLARVHVRSGSLSSWNLADQHTYTLPMIQHHIDNLRSRLSRSEARAIMGARLNKIGKTACVQGDLAHGLVMIFHSALLGYKPVKSLTLLVRASIAAVLRRLMSRRG